MLYDPKWDMSERRVVLEQFLAFAESKPRGAKFCYFYGHDCACGQFFASMGIEHNWFLDARLNAYNELAKRALLRDRGDPNADTTRATVKWSTLCAVLKEELAKYAPAA